MVSKVKAEISRDGALSMMKVVLDIEGAPDTRNPLLPGSGAIRPVSVVILAYPEGDGWRISLLNVVGPRLRGDHEAVTKRNYEMAFTIPPEGDPELPEWLQAIRQDWENRLNGFRRLGNFQIYASQVAMACERCDTSVTYGDEDLRLSSLMESAAAHTCVNESPARR